MSVDPIAQRIIAGGGTAALIGCIIVILVLAARKAFQSFHIGVGPAELDLRAKISDVYAEVKPNGGSSLRDAVDRIERKVDGQTDVLDDLSKRVEALEGKVT